MSAEKKKSAAKPFVSGLIAFAVAGGLYLTLFGVRSVLQALLCAGVSALAGWVVYQMAQGVDTSKKAPAQKKIQATGNSAVDSLITRGQEMLAQIRHENDLIADETLSNQMDELDEVAGKIFTTVAEQPVKAPQIRRFMEYYLPTTQKMLSGYRRLIERNVEGENADLTKEKIENAMGIVVDAFKKQLDQLYRDDMLDISTDIDVLETMLHQDGLIDSGLHGNAQMAARQTQS